MGERPIPEARRPGKRRRPRAPSCRPNSAQSQLARARAVGLVTGPHAHTPHTHSQWVVGPGRTPQKDERSGVGERSTPDAPHPGKRRPPRAPPCRPHSAQSQLARARAVGLVTGPHARTPQTHSQWVAGPRPHAPKDARAGVGERPIPDSPHPGERRPPRAPSCRPHSAQSQHTKAGLPAGGRVTPSKARGRRDRATLHKLNRRSKGPRQETRRGTNRLERPYGRPAPEPRVVRAPQRPGGGGGAYAAGARAHTHATDTWRGPEGQPDRARGTHRPHGIAYRQAKGRDTRAGQPATRTARDARAGRSPRRGARTGTGPDPPGQPRAPRTQDQGTAPAKEVVAHSATHQPHG